MRTTVPIGGGKVAGVVQRGVKVVGGGRRKLYEALDLQRNGSFHGVSWDRHPAALSFSLVPMICVLEESADRACTDEYPVQRYQEHQWGNTLLLMTRDDAHVGPNPS